MINGLSRPRKQFLDVLRVLATCAVVLMHVLTGATDVTDASKMPEYRGLLLAVMDLVTWCVPVFLLISGYLFLDPERELTYPVMIKKYCRRIALAILLFGVPYACSELMVAERSFRMGMLPEALQLTLTGHTWSHMWYLYLIFFLYLMTPLLRKALQLFPKWCIRGVLLFLFVGSSMMPFMNKVLNNSVLPVLPDGGIHVLYYICGYFFAQWEKTVDKKEKMQKVFGTMAAVLMLGMAGSRLLADFQIQMAYNYPFTVLLALLLFAAGWSGSPEKRSGEEVQKHRTLWQAAGTLSFAVYLVHPVYVNLLYKFMKITPFTLLEQSGVQSVTAGQVRLLFLLLAFCLLVLALSMATAWLLRKIPVLRKYVL